MMQYVKNSGNAMYIKDQNAQTAGQSFIVQEDVLQTHIMQPVQLQVFISMDVIFSERELNAQLW